MNITFKPADCTTSLVIFKHEVFDRWWSVSQLVMLGPWGRAVWASPAQTLHPGGTQEMLVAAGEREGGGREQTPRSASLSASPTVLCRVMSSPQKPLKSNIN